MISIINTLVIIVAMCLAKYDISNILEYIEATIQN